MADGSLFHGVTEGLQVGVAEHWIRVYLEGGELFRFAEGIMVFSFFLFYLGCSIAL